MRHNKTSLDLKRIIFTWLNMDRYIYIYKKWEYILSFKQINWIEVYFLIKFGQKKPKSSYFSKIELDYTEKCEIYIWKFYPTFLKVTFCIFKSILTFKNNFFKQWHGGWRVQSYIYEEFYSHFTYEKFRHQDNQITLHSNDRSSNKFPPQLTWFWDRENELDSRVSKNFHVQ